MINLLETPYNKLENCRGLIVPSIDTCKIKELSQTQIDIIQGQMPEPHFGDPDAPVYWLMGNPGSFDQNHVIPDIILRNVASFKEKRMAFDIPELKEHKGVDWLQKRTKMLKETVGHQPRIFSIEYYPYHSESICSFMRDPEALPSFVFYNKLIEDAIKANKVIVLARMKAEWKKRIPALCSYNRVIELKNPRCAYLTPGNMSEKSWKLLVELNRNNL